MKRWIQQDTEQTEGRAEKNGVGMISFFQAPGLFFLELKAGQVSGQTALFQRSTEQKERQSKIINIEEWTTV